MISLRRVTSGRAFIPQIDGLRFIAIMSVVLFHFISSLRRNTIAPSPFAGQEELFGVLSKRGVELFFCISGFILSTPFADARPVWRIQGKTQVLLPPSPHAP
jgi:peptidoglycan/LPS O-acetylase OafA/YrhL